MNLLIVDDGKTKSVPVRTCVVEFFPGGERWQLDGQHLKESNARVVQHRHVIP